MTSRAGALAAAADSSLLVINPIECAEVSVGFDRIEPLEAALPEELQREALPWDAAFLAAKACVAYRRRGGGGRRRALSGGRIWSHRSLSASWGCIFLPPVYLWGDASRACAVPGRRIPLLREDIRGPPGSGPSVFTPDVPPVERR